MFSGFGSFDFIFEGEGFEGKVTLCSKKLVSRYLSKRWAKSIEVGCHLTS